METGSASGLEHALEKVRELDGRGPVRVYKVVRSGRFLVLCGILALPMLGLPAQQQLLNLLEVLSAAALCLVVLNVAALVTSRVLIMIELLLYAAALLILVLVAFRITVLLATSDFDVFLKFLLALLPLAMSACLSYWIMYPGERIWAFDKRGPVGLVLWCTLVGPPVFAYFVVPSDRRVEFLWLLGGLVALFVFLKVFIPLAWSLARSGSLQLLRGHRRNRGYILYLFAHSSNRNRLAVVAFALACPPILAGVTYICLVAPRVLSEIQGLGGDIGNYGFRLGFVLVLFLFFLGLWLARLSYRKALEILAEGHDRARVTQLADKSGYTLYLRSFGDDKFDIDLADAGWRRLLLWLEPPNAPGFFQPFFRFTRLEEMIVRNLWPYRPVLSVAASARADMFRDVIYASSAADVFGAAVSAARFGPAAGEIYGSSVVGALQVNLPQEKWQAGVLRLAEKAECIVMIMAGTPGLRWEFQQMVLNSEYRERLILLVPPWTPDETAYRGHDVPTVRWRGLLGESRGGPRVAEELLFRTIAIRFDRNGSGVLLTAGEHSAAAYQLALHLAQLPLSLWSRQAKN